MGADCPVISVVDAVSAERIGYEVPQGAGTLALTQLEDALCQGTIKFLEHPKNESSSFF